MALREARFQDFGKCSTGGTNQPPENLISHSSGSLVLHLITVLIIHTQICAKFMQANTVR